MTNKDIFEQYKAFFKKYDLTIVDETWCNGYFIFEFGEDSVIHFKVKEVKGWLFGIWFNREYDGEEPKDQLFWQYERDIDKFKPSASVFLIEIPGKNRKGTFNGYCAEYCDYKALGQFEKDIAILKWDWRLARALESDYRIVSKKTYRELRRIDFLRNLINNFKGDVMINKGEFSMYVGGKPYPFKGLFLFLKHRGKIRWNR